MITKRDIQGRLLDELYSHWGYLRFGDRHPTPSPTNIQAFSKWVDLVQAPDAIFSYAIAEAWENVLRDEAPENPVGGEEQLAAAQSGIAEELASRQTEPDPSPTRRVRPDVADRGG